MGLSITLAPFDVVGLRVFRRYRNDFIGYDLSPVWQKQMISFSCSHSGVKAVLSGWVFAIIEGLVKPVLLTPLSRAFGPAHWLSRPQSLALTGDWGEIYPVIPNVSCSSCDTLAISTPIIGLISIPISDSVLGSRLLRLSAESRCRLDCCKVLRSILPSWSRL